MWSYATIIFFLSKILINLSSFLKYSDFIMLGYNQCLWISFQNITIDNEGYNVNIIILYEVEKVSQTYRFLSRNLY